MPPLARAGANAPLLRTQEARADEENGDVGERLDRPRGGTDGAFSASDEKTGYAVNQPEERSPETSDSDFIGLRDLLRSLNGLFLLPRRLPGRKFSSTSCCRFPQHPRFSDRQPSQRL